MNFIIIIHRNKVFIIIFLRLVVRMSEPTAKKAKLRNYRYFTMFGFVSVDSKPMCLEGGAILTNDSLRKVNL